MMSVGETLRRERLRRKVDLARVSEELKISSRMLEAIEADEYDKLPGGVFAKSFVRQYAAVLGLDEEEVATQFEQAVQSPELTRLAELRRPHTATGLPKLEEPRFSAARSRSALPSLIAVVVVMMICSGVYGWWQRSRQLAATRQERPPAAVARRAAPQPAVQSQRRPVQIPPKPATETIVAHNAGPAAAPPPASQPGMPQPLVPDTRISGPGAVHVELVAAEPVWVSVQRDGQSVYQGVLQPNEVRTLVANTEITLRVGNAGGLKILLNGKPIPPTGQEGEVRTVQLTSGGFQIVPPAAPAPAPHAPALLEPL